MLAFVLRLLWLGAVLQKVTSSWQPEGSGAPRPDLSTMMFIALGIYVVQTIAGAIGFLGFPLVAMLWAFTMVGWLLYFRGVLALSWLGALALLPIYLLADGLFSVAWRVVFWIL